MSDSVEIRKLILDVMTADTDERTGGQKSEKVSKIERLLADLDKIREK